MAPVVDWLAASGITGWAGGPPYAWINSAHLLGLVMLVGAIGVVDLRTVGFWRALPRQPLSHALTPVALVGLAISAATGALLFAADASALVGSDIFRLKLVLVTLALVNAVAFHLLWRGHTEPPVAARVMAALSIALWLAVALAGRMIAYR